MAHHHGHESRADGQDSRLWLSVFLNVGITAGEIVAGLLAGSLALLADALHNLSDVGALILAIVARRLGRRPPSTRHTYGLKRWEVISALVNAAVLFLVTGFIAKEAFVRILHPRPVNADIMLWAALGAFVVNMAAVLLLRKHEEHDLNVKSAFLHLLQDALASLAVVGAALFANTSVGPYLDPIASLVVGFAVLYSAFSIVVESLSIVTEAVPRGVDLEALVDSVDARFAPTRMHHVHVWEVGPGQRVLTAHLTVPDISVAASEELFFQIRSFLEDEWSIGHVTLQPEANGCQDDRETSGPPWMGR